MDSPGCGSELITENIQAEYARSLGSDAGKEIKCWAEKVWSLKDLPLVKLKQDWLSDTNGIDGALKANKHSKTYCDNSHILPLSSILKKGGML